MNRSILGWIWMTALAAVSCGSTPADLAEDNARRAVDVTPLLLRAGHSSNDQNLTVGLSERDLWCEEDTGSIRVYYGPTRPPPIERIMFVAWDMPAGVLAKGWELAQEADPAYWSLKLSAKTMGFGCDERYSASFFLLGAWGDKVSRPLGFPRASPSVFEDYDLARPPDNLEYLLYIDVRETDLQQPDTATFYLKNLFTGAASNTEVAVNVGNFGSNASLEVNLATLGLGATSDVAVGALLTRDGVELMNHCFTVRENPLP